MIRHRFYAGLWAMFFCIAAPSVGQAQYMKGETVVSAGAGLLFPTGVSSDAVKGGHSLYLSGEHALNPSWALGARISYLTFDAEAMATAATGLLRTRYLAFDLQARLYLYPESWFTPYAQSGLGLYAERNRSISGPSEQVADATRLGLTGGFGLSAHRQAGRTSLFTEVLYHHLPTDSQSKQFVQWSAGLRISFGGRPF
jgi:hypothetical protein